MDVVLENREENAYNASLELRYSGNLHFSSLTLQVRGPPMTWERWGPFGPIWIPQPIPGGR